jgi:two-component sensor histidine kinase
MSTSSSGASGKPPPAAAAPDIADRRQAIVAEIRHDLKNAHLAAAAALRQVGALARDGRLTAALAGLQAAVGEVQLHSERGLELLSLGVDDVEPALEPMALEPILREVELARRAAAELAGIALRSVPTGAVAAVDARLLARCVGNLVGNAIEHSGARRALIGVRRRGAGCVIEVRDDGRGIDVEAVRGVDGRRWAEGSGRGLGLWIASRFARLLGGELDVRAQAGRGSCFRLTLPGPVVWAPGSPRAASRGRARFDGMLVVLLEDDPGQLQAMRLAFERRGATVFAARNRVEFWSEIEQLARPPSLCVLNLAPGRVGQSRADGATPTSVHDVAWLKTRFGSRTKVVLLTAKPTDPQLEATADVLIFREPLEDATFDALRARLTSPHTSIG